MLLVWVAVVFGKTKMKGGRNAHKEARNTKVTGQLNQQETNSMANEEVVTLQPDVLWRIQAVQSGNFWFKDPRGRVVTSKRFFSLFKVRALGSGACQVVHYPSGRVLYHHPPELKRGAHDRILSTVFDTEDGSQLALLPPISKKRRMHSNPWGGSMYPDMSSPPPAPPLTEQETAGAYRAKAPHQIFFLVAQSSGDVLLRVGTSVSSCYVSETNRSSLEVLDADSKKRRSHQSLGTSAHFKLLQVSTQSTPAARLKRPEHHLTARRVKRSAILFDGRRLVVLTAYNVGELDITPYFWGWLNASGVRRVMLLENDGASCTSSKRLNHKFFDSISIDCVSCDELPWPSVDLPPSMANLAVSHWGAHTSVTCTLAM